MCRNFPYLCHLNKGKQSRSLTMAHRGPLTNLALVQHNAFGQVPLYSLTKLPRHLGATTHIPVCTVQLHVML